MDDNTQLIKTTKRLMLIFGIWHLDRNQSNLIKQIYSVYAIFNRTALAVLGVLYFLEVLRIIIDKDGLDVLFLTAALFMDMSRINAKLYVFEKMNMSRLLKSFIKDEEEVWKSTDQKIRDTYSWYVKYCHYLVSMQVTSLAITTLLHFTTHIYDNIKTNNYNIKHNLSLEAPVLYPIFLPNKDDHKILLYILNFIFAYECLLAPIVYILPTTCLVYCASQLNILQIKLEKLRDVSRRHYEGNVIKALKDLIEHHQSLIRFTTDLNDSIKYLILVDFILSSIIDASVVTQITKFESLSMVLSSVFYFLSLVILIFSVGWTCNEISVQSIALADAVYQSEWYEFDCNTKKVLQIIMMRTQHPLTIGIGPFGAMGNEAVILIMKATYSYMTLMQQ